MFCTILEYRAVPNDTPFRVVHNNTEYQFSKHLSLKYSQYLSEQFNQNRGKPICIDLECTDDDFHYIVDLFNFKRVFISCFNADFLEVAASFLKVQELIDNVTRFRLAHHELIENPTFAELASLSNKVFSLDQTDVQEELIEDSPICLLRKDDSYILKYDEKYRTSISHFIYFACISRPMKMNFYFQLLGNGKLLHDEFVKLMNSNIFTADVSYQLHQVLNEPSPLLVYKRVSCFEQDNNLSEYFRTINDMMILYLKNSTKFQEPIFTIISNDDVEAFTLACVRNKSLFDEYSLPGFREFNILLHLTLISGALKCFKYLYLGKKFKVTDSIMQAAIMGGNLEIFHILHQTKSPFDWKVEYLIKDAIVFHRNNILEWLITQYVHFLPIYSTCCSFLIYKGQYIEQKWYACANCHNGTEGCCKFCAEHCHISTEEHHHEITYKGIVNNCFCDDACEISNIEFDENKQFVEIDNLVLLSIISGNIEALEILIDNGADILDCRDGIASYAMALNDEPLFTLFRNMTGFDIEKDQVRKRVFDDTNPIFKS